MAAFTTGLAATSYTSSDMVCGPKTLSVEKQIRIINYHPEFLTSTLNHNDFPNENLFAEKEINSNKINQNMNITYQMHKQ